MSRRATTWIIAVLCVIGVGWALQSLDLMAMLRRLHGQ